jgi:site-specific recombinase XerD
MSYRTEEAYVQWMKRFIVFHHKRHPSTMGAAEIRAFLTHLAVDSKVAASTQNVALQALLFLYRQVLKQPLAEVDDFERAKAPGRIPVVLTQEEVAQVLGQLHGTPRLMASLLYGAGLRLMECVRLRVKDLDFPYAQITVHDGKGAQDRVTVAADTDRASARRGVMDWEWHISCFQRPEAGQSIQGHVSGRGQTESLTSIRGERGLEAHS